MNKKFELMNLPLAMQLDFRLKTLFDIYGFESVIKALATCNVKRNLRSPVNSLHLHIYNCRMYFGMKTIKQYFQDVYVSKAS